MTIEEMVANIDKKLDAAEKRKVEVENSLSGDTKTTIELSILENLIAQLDMAKKIALETLEHLDFVACDTTMHLLYRANIPKSEKEIDARILDYNYAGYINSHSMWLK